MQFTDIETKIFNLLEKTINLLGFDLVLVNLIGSGAKTLRVVIDGKNGVRLTVENCQDVSKAISPLLDVEDVVSGKYVLEVCSAGVERPLVKQDDYLRFVGRVILVKLHHTIDGSKKYEGKLCGFENNQIVLEINNGKNATDKIIPLESVKSANLVLTDEMFKAILKS
jgi:ribosome maturation factor RimP